MKLSRDIITESPPASGEKRRAFRKPFITLLAISALIVAFILGFALWQSGTPKLSVNLLKIIDGHGHWRLQLAITNVGTAPVITWGGGSLEILGQTNRLHVGASTPKEMLAPGEGHVIEAVLSQKEFAALQGKWRYVCQYAPADLRSRLYKWQWSKNGPGAKINWLVPRRLKGMPLTAKGTSDWIDGTN